MNPVASAKRALQRGFRRLGFEVVRFRPDVVRVPRHLCANGHKLYDFRSEPSFAPLVAEAKAQGLTKLDAARLFTLWQAVGNVVAVEGAMAEVGAFRGGSAAFLAAASEARGRVRQFHVFDTFTGHPPALLRDTDGPHRHAMKFAGTNLEDVRRHLSRFPTLILHPGVFGEKCVAVASERFAFVHVDVDIQESAAHCLAFFWPRLSPGGVMVVDDYGFSTCKGVMLAVNAFIEARSDVRSWYPHTGQLILQKA